MWKNHSRHKHISCGLQHGQRVIVAQPGRQKDLHAMLMCCSMFAACIISTCKWQLLQSQRHTCDMHLSVNKPAALLTVHAGGTSVLHITFTQQIPLLFLHLWTPRQLALLAGSWSVLGTLDCVLHYCSTITWQHTSSICNRYTA